MRKYTYAIEKLLLDGYKVDLHKYDRDN